MGSEHSEAEALDTGMGPTISGRCICGLNWRPDVESIGPMTAPGLGCVKTILGVGRAQD